MLNGPGVRVARTPHTPQSPKTPSRVRSSYPCATCPIKGQATAITTAGLLPGLGRSSADPRRGRAPTRPSCKPRALRTRHHGGQQGHQGSYPRAPSEWTVSRCHHAGHRRTHNPSNRLGHCPHLMPPFLLRKKPTSGNPILTFHTNYTS